MTLPKNIHINLSDLIRFELQGQAEYLETFAEHIEASLVFNRAIWAIDCGDNGEANAPRMFYIQHTPVYYSLAVSFLKLISACQCEGVPTERRDDHYSLNK